MKRIMLSVICSCCITPISYSMEGLYASFADAVAGKKRNIEQEIEVAEHDTGLNPLARAHLLVKLYGELRNKHRGKDEYAKYTKLICDYKEVAKQLEQQEKESTQQLKEQEARIAKEAALKEQIAKITADTSLDSLARCDAHIECYDQLKALFGANKEKYNLYESSRANVEQKKALLSLKASLTQITDKQKKSETFREISALCKKPVRAQKYRDMAAAMDQEIIQDEKQAKYQDILGLIAKSNDFAQKSKLHRVLIYYSDEHAEENRALAVQLEQQAEEEQEQRLILIEKTCKIIDLNAEIEKTATDKTLTSYRRTSTLAHLIESRMGLAQDVPKYKEQFAHDLVRVQKLRREAIGHATNDADRAAMIKLLSY